MTTYRLDLAHLAILAIDEHGEAHDLTGDGEPCRTIEELRAFAAELVDQGADAEAMQPIIDELACLTCSHGIG